MLYTEINLICHIYDQFDETIVFYICILISTVISKQILCKEQTNMISTAYMIVWKFDLLIIEFMQETNAEPD